MFIVYAYYQDDFVTDREAGETVLIGAAETEERAIACASSWVSERAHLNEEWVFSVQSYRKTAFIIAEEHKYNRCCIYAEEVPLYK